MFGVFHVVTASIFSEWRFLPSTFLGPVLGWVCYRTGSVLPGMALHTVHNGFMLLVAQYREQLEAWGIGGEAQSHLPAAWLAVSAVGIAAGIIAILVTTKAGFRERSA